jgi:hypothetical protein
MANEDPSKPNWESDFSVSDQTWYTKKHPNTDRCVKVSEEDKEEEARDRHDIITASAIEHQKVTDIPAVDYPTSDGSKARDSWEHSYQAMFFAAGSTNEVERGDFSNRIFLENDRVGCEIISWDENDDGITPKINVDDTTSISLSHSTFQNLVKDCGNKAIAKKAEEQSGESDVDSFADKSYEQFSDGKETTQRYLEYFEDDDFKTISTLTLVAAIGSIPLVATAGGTALAALGSGAILSASTAAYSASIGGIGIYEAFNRETASDRTKDEDSSAYTDMTVRDDDGMVLQIVEFTVDVPKGKAGGFDVRHHLPMYDHTYCGRLGEAELEVDITAREDHNYWVDIPLNDDVARSEVDCGSVTYEYDNCPDHTESPSEAKKNI